MSNSFTFFGVVIQSSPCVGWGVVPGDGTATMETLLKPYSLASRAITWLSCIEPEYSSGGRTRCHGTSSSTWCIARSPETSLMMEVICACVSRVRSSRSCAEASAGRARARSASARVVAFMRIGRLGLSDNARMPLAKSNGQMEISLPSRAPKESTYRDERRVRGDLAKRDERRVRGDLAKSDV